MVEHIDVGLCLTNPNHREDQKNHYYPYARSKTYGFLMAAIAEGAHCRLPLELQDVPNGEEKWVKMRNMAGVYYSSPAVEDDLGRQYQYGNKSRSANPNRREGPRRQIKRFMELLWENCSPAVRAQFSLEEIPLDKSLPERSRLKRGISDSVSLGGAMLKVLPHAYQGELRPKVISSLEGVSEAVVRHIIERERKRGHLPLGKLSYAQIEESLTRIGKDVSSDQRLLNRMSRAFIGAHRESFVSATDCLRFSGLAKVAHHRLSSVIEAFVTADIPFKVYPSKFRSNNGRIYANNFTYTYFMYRERAVAALKNSLGFQRTA